VFSVLDSLDDPRLDPYRELKRTNWTRQADWFIAVLLYQFTRVS
jgi:hypothetical protein